MLFFGGPSGASSLAARAAASAAAAAASAEAIELAAQAERGQQQLVEETADEEDACVVRHPIFGGLLAGAWIGTTQPAELRGVISPESWSCFAASANATLERCGRELRRERRFALAGLAVAISPFLFFFLAVSNAALFHKFFFSRAVHLLCLLPLVWILLPILVMRTNARIACSLTDCRLSLEDSCMQASVANPGVTFRLAGLPVVLAVPTFGPRRMLRPDLLPGLHTGLGYGGPAQLEAAGLGGDMNFLVLFRAAPGV